jgi:LPXTG-site transpeptidase (sortase) family protein
MFFNSGLSSENYDKLLADWVKLKLQKKVKFSGGTSTYCISQEEREILSKPVKEGGKGWLVYDYGMDCSNYDVTLTANNPKNRKNLPANTLPSTGFSKGVVTELKHLPENSIYQDPSIRLDIPKLDITLNIVGVPLTEGAWDVTWLGNNAGWLEGTAYPTWNGSSVITAHVWGADNAPGPFVNLSTLVYGDFVNINLDGKKYTYAVRESSAVPYWAAPETVFLHSDDPEIILITCSDYDESSGKYMKRWVTKAVLVAIEE